MSPLAPALVACAVLLSFAASAYASADGDVRARLSEAQRAAGAGKHREALDLLSTIISTGSVSGDRNLVAEAELLRSSSLRGLAEGAAAAEAAARALALGRALDDPGVRVRALVQLATLHSDRGDETRAAEYLSQAAPVARAAADPKLHMVIGEALAANARARGAGAEAVDYYGEVVAAADRANERDHSIRGRTGRSSALLGLGRYDEALADADRAYALAAGGPARLRASAAFSLAQVHAHLWNLEVASDLWQKAEALYREAGIQLGIALSLRQSMDTWFAMREFDRAAGAGEAALAMYEKTGSQGSGADTLARLALIEARRGRFEAARSYAGRARAAAATVPARRLVFIENDLGLVELYANRPREAASLFRRVREVAREQDDAEYEWRAQYGLGRAALAMDNAADAQAHLQQAAASLDRMRRGLPSPAQRATFMAQRGMVHEALVEALLARSKAPDDWFARRAYATAEEARARALADHLAEARSRSSDPTVRAMQARETEFSRRLSDIQKGLLGARHEAERESLMDQLAEAERQYDSLLAELRRGPHLAALAAAPPVQAAEIAARLESGEALIEFVISETGSWGFAFGGGRMSVFGVPPRRKLEEMVRALRGAISQDDMRGVRSAGAELTRALLAPAEPFLRDASRLVIVPDGPLHRLPFSALPGISGGWLIESHAISLAPSATILTTLRGRQSAPPRMLLALAAPAGNAVSRTAVWRTAGWDSLGALPNARAEAAEAARLAGGASLVRAPASEADVKRGEISEYRVLHFATHALVDERVPRRSAIVLDSDDVEDGLLQVNEIAHLPLNADLVVLAACRTQMGQALGGEGFLNLSRAFLQAGARSVIASLWDVNDADSRVLMRAFYGHLEAGAAPDEALRLAQLDIMRVPGPASMPDGWSAFVITGDASRPVVDSSLLTRSTAASAAVTLVALFLLIAAARGVKP
jgi:CHAT domain-containing protein